MSRKSAFRIGAAALLAAGLVCAQAPPAAPAFDVATIKPAEPPNMAQMSAGKIRVGMKIEAGRVDIGFMSLGDLIRTAYNLKSYQLSGPDWINTERFDILAKMPVGATKDDVPAMLRTLLAERFKLAVHKESKEHSIYALVKGKGELKLKESPADADAAPDAAPAGKGGAVVATNSGAVRINQDGASRGATITTPGEGTVRTSMGADGNMHLEMSRVSMAKFAELVSRFVDRPVLDETGIPGNYQVVLDLSMADMMRAARANGVAVPGLGATASRGAADAASDPGGGGSVFTAVQAMGLKLDARKEAVATYVVDRIEKTPTDN